MNELYGKQGTWKGDGSEGQFDVTASTVSLSSAKRGSPFNLYYYHHDDRSADDGSSSYSYFEVAVTQLDGSLSVGVVTPDEVQPGYKTRGMFYNGNLTNGAAALQVGFGNYVKEGTKVGVLMMRNGADQGDYDEVYFFVDDACLGLAFRLPPCSVEARQRYPCLHVTGSAAVQWNVPREIPRARSRELSSSAAAPADQRYVGDWKLVKLSTGGPEVGEMIPLPDTHNITASIKTMQVDNDDGSSKNAYGLSFKVANTIGATMIVAPKGNAKDDGDGFDKVQVTRGASTMMMPPPALRPIESALVKGLGDINRMNIVSNDNNNETLLLLAGPTIELRFEPFTKTFEPLTSYQ